MSLDLTNLTDHLQSHEKLSIARSLSVNDKVLASGVCRLLHSDGSAWVDKDPPAVVMFIKNSSEKIYKISVIEPSTDAQWEPVCLLRHVSRQLNFNLKTVHPNLLILHTDQQTYGLNFYDKEESRKFNTTINTTAHQTEQRKKEKKSKLSGFLQNPFKKKKCVEIGPPTDFRHVGHGENSENQMGREDEARRRSMMIRKEVKTPGKVKKSSVRKVEEKNIASFQLPLDPLNPDWGNEDTQHRLGFEKITASAPIKISHTLGSNNKGIIGNTSVYPDTKPAANQFEETQAPTPPLHMRLIRDTSPPPPLLPQHRKSYRMATKCSEERVHVNQTPLSIRKVMVSPISTPASTPLSSSPNTETILTKSGPPAPPPPPLMTPLASPTILEERGTTKSFPDISGGKSDLLLAIQNVDKSKLLRKVSENNNISPRNTRVTSGDMFEQIQKVMTERRSGIQPSDSELDEDSDDGEWSD